jgi:hypothetical protein
MTTLVFSYRKDGMLSLPIACTRVIGIFAPVFSRPVWQHVKVLLTGALLAPGKRTITALRHMMGRSAAPAFQSYHRGLHRAGWSPLIARRLLLRCLGAGFLPPGIVVCGLADPIERRRGARSTATGIYRDPGRSSLPILGRSAACAGSPGWWWLPYRGRSASGCCPF